MAKIKVPYFQWKNGRPRWEPSPELRRDGWKGKALKDDTGEYLELPAAIAAAQEINDKVNEWRKGRATLPLQKKKEKPLVRNCNALAAHYQKSDRFLRVAPKTQKDYRNKLNVFLKDFGLAPVEAVKSKQLFGFWQHLKENRGHAMASGVIAVVRRMFTHGVKEGWLAKNPAVALDITTPKPRVVVWSPEQVALIIRTADRMGLHSIADAVILALHSGQRQRDVLDLVHEKVTGNTIRLRQNKTNVLVNVRQTRHLKERLNAIRARKNAAGLSHIPELVVSETTGKAYKSDHFTHKFADVRAQAVRKMPSIAGLEFRDLRDTTVTRMGMAGCTIPEIIAITGHSLKTATQILNHYLAPNSEMADAGMDKMDSWLDEQGISY